MVKLLLQQEVVFLNINKKDPNKFFLLRGISRWADWLNFLSGGSLKWKAVSETVNCTSCFHKHIVLNFPSWLGAIYVCMETTRKHTYLPNLHPCFPDAPTPHLLILHVSPSPTNPNSIILILKWFERRSRQTAEDRQTCGLSERQQGCLNSQFKQGKTYLRSDRGRKRDVHRYRHCCDLYVCAFE